MEIQTKTAKKQEKKIDITVIENKKRKIHLLFQNIKYVNDDGWLVITIIAFMMAIFTFIASNNFIHFFCGFLIGSFYEQVIEFLAHGWLQHKNNKVFDYFVARHLRHHRETEHHHALQSIFMTIFVVTILLVPFLFLYFIGYKDIPLGVISGFLLTHVLLNILHYDIHTETKIIPKFLRKSRYYRYVFFYHMLHHKKHHKLAIQIYGITNPWLDIFLDKVGITLLIDSVYSSFVKVLESSKIVTTFIKLINPVCK